jgi:hypothetical protein
MKDTFDLTKFLKENKSLENLNPTFKSLNENKHVKDKIREMILAELNEDTALPMKPMTQFMKMNLKKLKKTKILKT